MKKSSYSTAVFVLFLFINSHLCAQTVSVGKGSYSTVLPSGTVGLQNSSGSNISPKVSSTFQLPPQTNDFWSSLIFPFYGDAYSNNIYAHPLYYKAKSNGLQLGYTTTPVYSAQDYLFPFSQQLTVGVTDLAASKTSTDNYGDWTVSALWDDGTHKMKATLGHGLPFAFFTISGGSASITCSTAPTIWSNVNGVLGITVEGRHYGIFAPDSSQWTGTSTLQSSLNGKDYLSIALLPDNSTVTLELFRKHAYAFVIGSSVAWLYDDVTAKLTTTFSYSTELKESKNGNLNQTLTALYRHQWLNTAASFTNYEYNTVAGKMKVFDGNQFSTNLTFEGVLPALPDQGDYNRTELLAMVNSVAAQKLPSGGDSGGTYWNAKLTARFAHLVNIADQLGATSVRDYFLSAIKSRLEAWFTAGGVETYVYNSTWRTLTGYPSEFGADNQLNDHNFHAGYAIMVAAIIAQYDSVWAAKENWGGMVELLIKDANNWDRTDVRFPFLRAFDAYAGHSWEAGHGDFGDGNNEESSSESMNFATAVTLWGTATHQREIRDLGIYLYATQRTAIEQYWFDIDDSVFPSTYAYKALGMVWGGKGVHSTWFGANADYIHGINMLPINGGSMYLGRHPDYVQINYNETISELNGTAAIWKDILWEYLAFVDPGTALSLFLSNSTYTPEDGESKAHTYHWLSNLKKMGRLDISVTADIPTYSVFKNSLGAKTYVGYNASSDSITVHYSDGYSMRVPPRVMRSINTSSSIDNAPVAILTADKTSGKIPLTVNFSGKQSFDKNSSPLTYSWVFGDGGTSVSMDTVHIYTIAGTYKAFLTVTNQLMISTKDSVQIIVNGNGTPYSGTPFNIPGTLQAENYDKGGEGVAYHDVDANNIGLVYRPTEGVDLEGASDNAYDVYWMVSGEWLEYTIQTAVDGNYDIIPYVATVPGFGYFRILIDNVDVSGKQSVLSTGGFQIWKAIKVANVSLKAGKHILRFEIDTDVSSEKKNWLFSLNYIQINKSTGTGVTDLNAKPKEYSLGQNFPNPFNPATTITYALPFESKIKIEVFNLLGEVVKEFIYGSVPAGYGEIKFNGAELTSGIYFYRIDASSTDGKQKYQNSKKMILVK